MLLFVYDRMLKMTIQMLSMIINIAIAGVCSVLLIISPFFKIRDIQKISN